MLSDGRLLDVGAAGASRLGRWMGLAGGARLEAWEKF